MGTNEENTGDARRTQFRRRRLARQRVARKVRHDLAEGIVRLPRRLQRD
jgi:hypothetical protein